MVTQSSAQVPSEANLQDIVAASERVKARFGERQHGVNPRDPTKPAMTDTTSTGEELMRGNAQPMGGFAQGTYQQVIGATKARAQSSGAAAPGGVMAPGGGRSAAAGSLDRPYRRNTTGCGTVLGRKRQIACKDGCLCSVPSKAAADH